MCWGKLCHVGANYGMSGQQLQRVEAITAFRGKLGRVRQIMACWGNNYGMSGQITEHLVNITRH